MGDECWVHNYNLELKASHFNIVTPLFPEVKIPGTSFPLENV